MPCVKALVKRTDHPKPVRSHRHVQIDFSGVHVLVAEQVLDAAQVSATFQQMRGETMPQGMTGDPLFNACLTCRIADRPVVNLLVQMMPALGVGFGIGRDLACGKQPEPLETSRRPSEFPREGPWDVNAPQPRPAVFFPESARLPRKDLRSRGSPSGMSTEVCLQLFIQKFSPCAAL